jgi:hypothetical protein
VVAAVHGDVQEAGAARQMNKAGDITARGEYGSIE